MAHQSSPSIWCYSGPPMSNFQTHLWPPQSQFVPPSGFRFAKNVSIKVSLCTTKNTTNTKKETWAKLLTEIGCRAMSYKYIYIFVYMFFGFLVLLTTCFFLFFCEVSVVRFPFSQRNEKVKCGNEERPPRLSYSAIYTPSEVHSFSFYFSFYKSCFFSPTSQLCSVFFLSQFQKKKKKKLMY